LTIEVPDTISAEARGAMAALLAAAKAAAGGGPVTVEASRAGADEVQARIGASQVARYGVRVTDTTRGGLPARRFEPAGGLADGERILLNFHGGGFMVDSGSMTENVPIAALTGLPVVSVLYRMAPEHPFPAAVDDALAAYRALLARYAPERIGLYGTSAGAILSAQLVHRLMVEGLPQPAALGFFSGIADFARDGDIEALLARAPGGSIGKSMAHFYGATSRADPALSPIFGDLSLVPPTLVISSTRDQLLSHSVMYHRALQRAGREAELAVFEGLPHAFWAYIEAPESDEAFALMAGFLSKRLG
jgi:acetyl esterase/lipase